MNTLRIQIEHIYICSNTFIYSRDSHAHSTQREREGERETYTLLGPGPVTMTSPAVCLGPLSGFGRGWGWMLKKPGEAKHIVLLCGLGEVEAWSEGGVDGCCSPRHTTPFFPFPSSPSILSVCRDPMCVSQAVEHPFCLFYLFFFLISCVLFYLFKLCFFLFRIVQRKA